MKTKEKALKLELSTTFLINVCFAFWIPHTHLYNLFLLWGHIAKRYYRSSLFAFSRELKLLVLSGGLTWLLSLQVRDLPWWRREIHFPRFSFTPLIIVDEIFICRLSSNVCLLRYSGGQEIYLASQWLIMLIGNTWKYENIIGRMTISIWQHTHKAFFIETIHDKWLHQTMNVLVLKGQYHA